MTDKLVILSTCASEAEAETLARALVESRAAACVNVLPAIRSFYRPQPVKRHDPIGRASP